MTHNFDFDTPSQVNPFSVPDGYFEDFSLRMEALTATKKISFYQRYRSYIYTVAAVVLLVISVGSFVLLSDKKDANFPHVESQALVEYNDMLHDILLEETNEDMVIDYILAEAE